MTGMDAALVLLAGGAVMPVDPPTPARALSDGPETQASFRPPSIYGTSVASGSRSCSTPSFSRNLPGSGRST